MNYENLPKSVTFDHTGLYGPEARLDDGIFVVPSMDSPFKPELGETWEIKLVRIVTRGRTYALVDCTPTPFKLKATPTQSRSDRFRQRHGKTVKLTGKIRRRASLDGPNVLSHVTREMREAGKAQKALARVKSVRGEVVRQNKRNGKSKEGKAA